jgi:hypothetical protein
VEAAVTVDEWHAKISWLKAHQSVEVKVGELSELIADYVALRARMDAVEEWAYRNVEGDGLRRVLSPSKGKVKR